MSKELAGMIQGRVSVGALTVYISLGGLILNSSENFFGGRSVLKKRTICDSEGTAKYHR